MDQDNLTAKQQAVINAAKALFSPTGADNQIAAFEANQDRRKALHGAVRELEAMEKYSNGHPLVHEPEEVYRCMECDACSMTLGEVDDNGGVSHAHCGQCYGSDIWWYVAVHVDNHHQMDTAKDALTKAMNK